MVVRNVRVYFSRFPDARVTYENEEPEEVVCAHEAPDGFDVVTWVRDPFSGDWEDSKPLFVENLASVRTFAPSDAYQAVVDEDVEIEGLGRCIQAWAR